MSGRGGRVPVNRVGVVLLVVAAAFDAAVLIVVGIHEAVAGGSNPVGWTRHPPPVGIAPIFFTSTWTS